jgi:aryl-alcohol dehydrogenase-like predicted oxidoreductase
MHVAQLRTTQLGQTGLEITRVGFGAWATGGGGCSPMRSGLLTGAITRERIAGLPDDDWRKRDARFKEPQPSRHLAPVERLRMVAERHDSTPGAVAAAAWTLRHPAVHGAILGFRRPDQVESVLGAGRLVLSA